MLSYYEEKTLLGINLALPSPPAIALKICASPAAGSNADLQPEVLPEGVSV